MTRAWLAALILPILAGRASADPAPEPWSGVHLYGLIDYALFETAVPGIGFGVELDAGDESVSLDVSGGAIPICFIACALYDWVGASAAYHHQVSEHLFVGPRVGVLDRVVGEPTQSNDADIYGWAAIGVVETGFRRHTNGGRIAAASVGAGVSINADRKLWPTVTVRVTYGR